MDAPPPYPASQANAAGAFTNSVEKGAQNHGYRRKEAADD
jgi:hypothetical protein